MKVFVTDPDTLTPIPKRTYGELEEFVVFCVCVAGKTARVVRRCLDKFWDGVIQELHRRGEFAAHEWWGKKGPFAILREYTISQIGVRLRDAGIGCHGMKASALHELSHSDFDLHEVTVEQLESVHGIGPKTARFFIMFSRPNARYACLDTHILAWLRGRGIDAPKSTPSSGRKYRQLEAQFLNMVPEGMTPAEFDLQIWLSARK